MSGYVLAIDQGTTSSRAIVFDDKQQIVGMGKMEFTQHFPASGWVEHVPDEIWATCLWSVKTALRKAGITASEIAAIGITNQRETTLVWDRATGKAIHNAIVWQDRRCAPICARLVKQGYEKMVARKTGLLLDPYFSGPK
ncbi:MAG: FGGY family carbohydrate kinase, partial [Devosia sp.]